MDSLLGFVKISVYLLMALSLVAALGVVMMRSIFHAALCLAAALIGIAGIYLTLKADFLAVIQILIYVGAVMTLIIFAIMLTERFGDKTILQQNRLGLPAFFGTAVLATVLFKLIWKTHWTLQPLNWEAKVQSVDLGKALLGTYIFPFEVISVVLIAALIGAIVVARRDKPS